MSTDNKREASPVKSAGNKIKMTEEEEVEVPGLVTKVMSSNTVILETVFSHLSSRDIKTAALVSRTWRMVVETPRYWTKMILRVDDFNVCEIMKSKIIKLVPQIKFGTSDFITWDIEDISQSRKSLRIFERLLRAVVTNELSQLKTIQTSINLGKGSKIPPLYLVDFSIRV